MARVLIYAIPFGFGPLGKSAVIGNHLGEAHDVRMTTFGDSVELLSRSVARASTVDCVERNPERWPESLVRDVDVFISVMDTRAPSVVSARVPGIKTIFIDSLLWWRNVSPERIRGLSSYVAQYFPGIEGQLALLADAGVSPIVVGPIVSVEGSRLNPAKVERSILVYYGGVESSVTHHGIYWPFVKNLTGEITEFGSLGAHVGLVISGSSATIDALQRTFGSLSEVQFGNFPYMQFQKQLSGAQCIIATPGIEIAYEATFHNTPVVFLPPLNSTQGYQLLRFAEHGWLHVLEPQHLEQINHILESSQDPNQQTLRLSQFANELALHGLDRLVATLAAKIRGLTTDPSMLSLALARQRAFIPGGLPNGLDTIRTEIDDLLQGMKPRDENLSLRHPERCSDAELARPPIPETR